MRRPANYARSVAPIDRTIAPAFDTETSHEVQGEIDATRLVVPGLGISRERPTGRHALLAQHHTERSAETGLGKNSVETGTGNGLGSVAIARAWPAGGRSDERTRTAMEKPFGLELAIRRQLPTLPWIRNSEVDTTMTSMKRPSLLRPLPMLHISEIETHA